MITLTESATTQVKQLIDAEDDDSLALRVEVGPGGCSGYSYNMYFDTEVKADDVSVDHDGVTVLADPQSAALLTGATLDYKHGLDQSGFSISNPSTGGGCGCGKNTGSSCH